MNTTPRPKIGSHHHLPGSSSPVTIRAFHARGRLARVRTSAGGHLLVSLAALSPADAIVGAL